MNDPVCPHVVYHCCAVNHYQDIVRSQLLLLRQCGLTAALVAAGDHLRISHVGPDPHWILEEAARHDLPARIVMHHDSITHYETGAMLEIERLAKVDRTDRPILYFHTKGVTAPGDAVKVKWRRVMEWHCLENWRDRVRQLSTFDASGFNFWFRGAQHFSGTFWVASGEWIRQLPDFVQFHAAQQRVRFSCELWIGSASGIRAASCGCNDLITWAPGFDWSWLMPPAIAAGDEITWISLATPQYADALKNLEKSAARLGAGHTFRGTLVPDYGPWVHSRKLEHLAGVLPQIKTSHAFWIDADSEFLTSLAASDLMHPGKPLSAVRHPAYQSIVERVPEAMRHLIVHNRPVCHQACLFGGTVEKMRELVSRAFTTCGARSTNDEVGLNLVWDELGPDVLHTLDCRYNTPTRFLHPWLVEGEVRRRSAGAARIFHFCTELFRCCQPS